jgi:Ca2+-transporting ATPase
MNLVTDGIPALALAVDPKAPDLMSRPPRRPDDRLLNRARLVSIAGEGLMLALIALGAFSASLFLWDQNIDQARTVTFTVMVVAQLVHAFNSRSDRLSLFQLGLFSNRPLMWAFLLSLGVQLAVLTVPVAAPIFKVVPLPLEDWELMASMGLVPLILMETVKWVRRREG